jgi:hypothetical protein
MTISGLSNETEAVQQAKGTVALKGAVARDCLVIVRRTTRYRSSIDPLEFGHRRPEWRTPMCYCDNDDHAILRDLEGDEVPDDALVSACCWARVCQVRGRSFSGSETSPS